MSEIPADVEAEANALEAKARQLRDRARWGEDTPYFEAARDLLNTWLNDPGMWATHGMPGEGKLDRIERDIAALLKAHSNA